MDETSFRGALREDQHRILSCQKQRAENTKMRVMDVELRPIPFPQAKSLADEAKRSKIESMYQRSARLFPEVAEVTADEVSVLQRENTVVLVDVRSEEEQAVSMIPGAVSSRYFEENRSRYKGSPVVVYCTVGHRSGLYARSLESEGWEVFNLKGAILAWTHSGGALKNAQGFTRRVHVYNKKCDLAAEGYEGVW